MSGKRWTLLTLLILHCAAVWAEDWPTYLHDSRRSGVTAEQPGLPLHEHWTFVARHAPQPAWPETGNGPSRVRFDVAYDVAVAGDALYFGSSTDNKIYALNAATGEERWSAFTGGPIRVAPTVHGDCVYVASDDGCAYCLKAADGGEAWRFRAAPGDEKVLGNGRMISLWPMRTGVLVEDDIAYFCAGLFPAEGVYVHAVRAQDGTPVWKNDTAGQMYILQPHPSAEGFTGISPQGPLLASASRLYVPTGRSVPAAFDRSDGRFLYWHAVTTKYGGAWALLADDLIINSPGSLIAYENKSGGKFAQFFGTRIIVTPDTSYLLTPTNLSALDRKAYMERSGESTAIDDKIAALSLEGRKLTSDLDRLRSRQKALKKEGNDLSEQEMAQLQKLQAEQAAFDEKRKAFYEERTKARAALAPCARWTTPCVCPHAMILAGDVLFAGGDGQVIALDAKTGKQVWTSKVSGKAHGLAFANGRLFVSTDKGTIHCFAKEMESAKQIKQPLAQSPYPKDELTALYQRAAEEIVKATGTKKGYCLVLGCGTGRLMFELAGRTDLKIYGVDPDGKKVEAARKALDAAGLYGVRATVDQAPLDRMPYANYFANLIVCDDVAGPVEISPVLQEEISRMVKPCGGVAYVKGPDGKMTKTVRGPIEGAADWTHQYADAGNANSSDDKALECPLTVLWFGEPGPEKMVNRHCHGPAPLSTGGRLFVCGNDVVMAYDAYNGAPLWEQGVPGCRRVFVEDDTGSFVAAQDSIYVAAGDHCVRLDADTGKRMANWALPGEKKGIEMQWGYLAYEGDLLFGSASPSFTARRIDEDAQRALAKAKVPSTVGERLSSLHGRNVTTREELRQAIGEILSEEEMGKYEKQLLDDPGLPHGGILSHYVFAMDRNTGQEKWVYPIPGGYVYHNGIALGGGRMFLIETDANTKQVRLVALDVQTGEKLWETSPRNIGSGSSTMMLVHKGGVLVVRGVRVAAFSADNGKEIWHAPAKMRGRLAIAGETIVGEPCAYDLRTGKQATRLHPVTGEAVPWQFLRAYGCGTISSSGNCLMFRSASIGYYDLKNDFGTTGFGGTRPGCWINCIGAAGLMLVPEGSSGCTCSYAIITSLALQPGKTTRAWSVFSSPGAMTPVKRLAINLGAPGDRKDAEGVLWLGYPRPCQRFGLKLDLKAVILSDMGYFRQNAERAGIEGTSRPWVFSSGCCGLSRCVVPVDAPGNEGVYTVRLAFAELAPVEPGRRVFDVKIQGKTVLKDFDIVRESGGPRRALIKEFTNIKTSGSIEIEFVPKVENPSMEQAPIVNGIEVLKAG